MASAPETEAYRAGYREGYDNALAEQPFDRAAIIEECARVAEYANGEGGSFLWVGQQIATAIRALKDKPT